jgi:Clr5 domain
MRKYVSHVGRHMEDIALSVLPRNVESDESDEEDDLAKHDEDDSVQHEEDDLGGFRSAVQRRQSRVLEWDAKRDLILHLYEREKGPLREVVEIMRKKHN